MRGAEQIILLGGAGSRKPSYNPVAALGTDLIAYWDVNHADTLNTLSGTTAGAPVGVEFWNDIVAGYVAMQTTAADQPQVSPSSFNGFPGLTGDGVQDYLVSTDAGLLAALPSGSNPYEIWIVLANAAAPTDTTERIAVAIGGASLTTGVAISRVVTTGVNRAHGRTGTGSASIGVNDATVDFSNYHVVRYAMGATQSSLTIDGGTPVDTAAAVPSITNSRLRIFASSASGPVSFWQGQVAAVLITKPLSASEAAGLQAYLNSRAANGDIGTAGLPGTSYWFGTDFHYDPNQAATLNKYFQDTVTKIGLSAALINARSDLSLAFCNGDMIDGSSTTTIAQSDLGAVVTAVNAINIPKIIIPGNHDLLHLTKAQFYAQSGQSSGYFSQVVTGPGGPFTLIVLDGNYTADSDSAHRSNDNGVNSQYISFINPAQRAWLIATVAASPYLCVIHCHYPIYYNGLDTSGTWQINNSAAVRAIIEPSGKVIVCFSGHVHQNWFYQDPVSGVWYVTLHAFVTGASPMLTYSVPTIYPAKKAWKVVSTGYSLSHLPAL